MTHEQNEHLRARYDEGVAALDFEIGRVVEALKKLGVYNATTLIVTSDHGEFFGEQGRYLHGAPWEEGHRVPLIIKPPSQEQRKPLLVEGLTESTDIFPTVLDAAGVIYPMEGLDGVSLWACAKGDIAIAPKLAVYGSTSSHSAFVRKGRYK